MTPPPSSGSGFRSGPGPGFGPDSGLGPSSDSALAAGSGLDSATVLHDPTSETAPMVRPRVPPPTSLDGKTVGLFDLGKLRSDEFLDHLEARLRARGVVTRRFAKPTNAKPAAPALLARIAAGADVVVEALAD